MKKYNTVHASDTNDLYGVSIKTGFPNPAMDAPLNNPDFNKLLIRHPVATYCMRIAGSNWERAGIYDGDIVVIDRAVSPGPMDTVVWWQDDSFTLGQLRNLDQRLTPWGTITNVIHSYR